MRTTHIFILIVILVICSITFMSDMDGFGMSYTTVAQTQPINNIVDGFGMSPGTLTQLSSTSVEPRKMYLLY